MRGREKRVAKAISEWLRQTRAVPDPDTMAKVVGTATKSTGCALVIHGRRYQWGAAGPWSEATIDYAGERQGTLAVTPKSAGKPLRRIASLLGAPVAAARLAAETDELLREGDMAARALIDDRWRAIVEMEHERRMLERDLHDGAQHHLVALRMAFAILEHGQSEAATREHAASLLARWESAKRALMDTAAGVAPVTLVCDGLAAALSAELAGHDDVVLDISDLHRRYPPMIESAVYYICLEAVNNAHKHAPASDITVTVASSYHGIRFVVTDNGPGLPPGNDTGPHHKLSERAATVGGTVTIHSTPGQGVTVAGLVRL